MKALILTLILLTACAHAQTHWTSPTGDREQFARDNYRCMQESTTTWSGFGLIGYFVSKASAQHRAEHLFQACMESAGYRLAKE